MSDVFNAEIYVDEKSGKTWVQMTQDGKIKRAPRGMGNLIDVAIDQIIPQKYEGWHRKFTPTPEGEHVGTARIKVPEKFQKKSEDSSSNGSSMATAFEEAATKKIETEKKVATK